MQTRLRPVNRMPLTIKIVYLISGLLTKRSNVKKIIRFIFYSKYTPVLSWAVILIFLLCLYLILMPIAGQNWPTSPLRKFIEISILSITLLWPLYCIFLSIKFLVKKENTTFAIYGLLLNMIWLIFFVTIIFMGQSV